MSFAKIYVPGQKKLPDAIKGLKLKKGDLVVFGHRNTDTYVVGHNMRNNLVKLTDKLGGAGYGELPPEFEVPYKYPLNYWIGKDELHDNVVGLSVKLDPSIVKEVLAKRPKDGDRVLIAGKMMEVCGATNESAKLGYVMALSQDEWYAQFI